MIKVFLNNIVLVITLSLGIYYTLVPVEYQPSVIFMDVGQGDAILLIDSSGEKVLIDGGDGDYVVYNIAKYLHPRDRIIDVIILTHPHQDHMSGLVDIMERYTVKEIYYYPACYKSKLYEHFKNLDENILPVSKDYVFEGNSFTLEVLYPLQDYNYTECLNYPNINNASIVTRLTSDSGTILFMGDAEHEQEDILMKKYAKRDIQSDILKAGHHCSRTASSERFMKYIEPKYIVCMVGQENQFGHPHKEVLDIFKDFSVPFELTFETGDIVLDI